MRREGEEKKKKESIVLSLYSLDPLSCARFLFFSCLTASIDVEEV